MSLRYSKLFSKFQSLPDNFEWLGKAGRCFLKNVLCVLCILTSKWVHCIPAAGLILFLFSLQKQEKLTKSETNMTSLYFPLESSSVWVSTSV